MFHSSGSVFSSLYSSYVHSMISSSHIELYSSSVISSFLSLFISHMSMMIFSFSSYSFNSNNSHSLLSQRLFISTQGCAQSIESSFVIVGVSITSISCTIGVPSCEWSSSCPRVSSYSSTIISSGVSSPILFISTHFSAQST